MPRFQLPRSQLARSQLARSQLARFQLPCDWPEPADMVRAARLAEQIRPRRGHPEDAALVACLGGNSPYLAGLAVRERACFDRLIRHGPDAVVETALSALAALDASAPRAAIASALRQAKRQVALASGIADIGGLWNLGQVTGALSRLADAALGAAVRHLLAAAASRRELVLRDPVGLTPGCGFVVLGMGKLGARELNYSSDIDLMLLYDPQAHPGHDELQRVFTRMATDLVTLMQARDADGYVFRTDLRLRPDPSSTPPAISLPAAITYYESLGQTWERAAMTKARPVAGDLACGQAFLATIRPFMWRRHLDFAVIDDIRAMKRRIDRHRGAPPLDPAGSVASLLGHDLKLGHGGIREIEFLAQTMQLVWGGRAPELRDPTTLGALEALASGNHLPAGLAAELGASYRLLRRAEHRLQMQDDRQTHSLPATAQAFGEFAVFMGEADDRVLAATLTGALVRTRQAFEDWFADGGETGARFDLDAEDLPGRLVAIGFPQPLRAAAILAAWRARHLRALRSDRAQGLLREILPGLLAALGAQRDPMLALTRFDALLARQNAGVQLLSLLMRNPPLIGRIAAVLGAAPSLAEHLALVPAALEGLLVPEDGREAARLLRLVDAQLRSADGVEEAIRRARRLVRGEEFRLSLAQMDGRLDVDRAGMARSDLADRVIRRMLDHVRRDHVARHGSVPGGGMVVVALGKAGSREMMAGSDLDLMLVYDHPEDLTESLMPRRGPGMRPGSGRRKPLPVSQYYIRLAHSLIAALSAPGAEGPLYSLDMRLRPSGSKGPLAVSLPAFRRYHAERSWTWERMALSRARVVAGPGPMGRRVTAAIGDVLAPKSLTPKSLTCGIPRNTLLHDAASMRARLASDLPPRGPWDVKLRAGGLMEVEFIAQIMPLAGHGPGLDHAARNAGYSGHPTTRVALRRLAGSGVMTRAEARRLIEADRFWRALQSMLRILFGTGLPRSLDDATLPELEALLHGVAASCTAGSTWPSGLAGLEDRMGQMSRRVRAAFCRLIGDPDAVLHATPIDKEPHG